MFFLICYHTDDTREEWSPYGRRAGDEEMERKERGGKRGGDSYLHLGKPKNWKSRSGERDGMRFMF